VDGVFPLDEEFQGGNYGATGAGNRAHHSAFPESSKDENY
jgi:hypothetical protein